MTPEPVSGLLERGMEGPEPQVLAYHLFLWSLFFPFQPEAALKFPGCEDVPDSFYLCLGPAVFFRDSIS